MDLFKDLNFIFNSLPSYPCSLLKSSANQIAIVTQTGVFIHTPRERKNITDSQWDRTSITNNIKYQKHYKVIKDQCFRISELTDQFRCAVWSPLQCSLLGGCMLITVTTGNQVLLYEADSNPSIEEWKIVTNFTKLLQQHYKFDLNTLTNEDINKIEIISVDWSPYNNNDDISLIALGSKAGNITIWKFENDIRYFTSVDLFDTYVYSMKWTNWYFSDNGDGYIYLIAGSCEGEIKAVKFKINLKTKKCHIKIKSISSSDNLIVSIIELSEDYNNDGKCSLAVVKGTLINIYDLDLKSDHFIQKNTMKSFSIPYVMTIGSLQFYDYDNIIRIYTMDGKAIDIDITTKGGEEDKNGLIIKNDNTLSFLKAIFYHPVENQDESEINKTQSFLNFVEENSAVPRYFGAQKSMNELCDTILYITYAPKAMNYRTSSSSYCYLLVYSNYLIKGPSDIFETNVIKNIDHWLKDELLFQKYTPSCLLWDIIQYTEKVKNNNEDASENFCMKVINHLMTYNKNQEYINDIIDIKVDEEGSKNPSLYILKLAKQLYRNKIINSLKLINSFIQSIKFLLLEKHSKQVNIIKQKNVEIIHNYYARNFIHLFLKLNISKYYNDEQSVISILLICDSLLKQYKINKDILPIIKKIYLLIKKNCKSSSDSINVNNELQIISDIENGIIEKREKEIALKKENSNSKTQETNNSNTSTTTTTTTTTNNNNNNNNIEDDIIHLTSREKCPACLTNISYKWISYGVCENGHSWDRCSNTLLITSTPYIKSCQSCNCKALVDAHPRSNIKVPLIVKDIQNHFKSCIYCGNQFKYLL
ncbi:hypothetical protein BCR32DRAFT_268600 [Anaeromyces robustus]|uniref:Transcription factor IIIC putative zinc-finger domain-containing protein n=1 Tax=Anaeromyces robustus TaxID=1754192 RepID=A0A1Y1X539_9FUNG|nr:hypothetical protein BCR32DRAFT_268600 [Anaeromyces robustus]|eukprot:ORX80940.1 hypothetical protein BCR32DRAFT_268600 [Anaeromyces robustus]